MEAQEQTPEQEEAVKEILDVPWSMKTIKQLLAVWGDSLYGVGLCDPERAMDRERVMHGILEGEVNKLERALEKE